jgi:hypothetical protein
MATGSVSLINVASVVSLATTDSLFVNSNNSVRQANANEVFSASAVEVGTLLIGNNFTPANSTANVEMGSFWFDNNYAYFAIANSVIRRVALTSF